MNDPKRLAAVIREMHGCQASHQCSERVTETFRGETVWDGVVEVFSITGRDDADTAYAWTSEDDDGKLHHLAVLGVPPINSAQAAVKAAVAAYVKRLERLSLILDDESELPIDPSDAESTLAERMGVEGLAIIDSALRSHTVDRWRKVARVVLNAIGASGASADEEGLIALHTRRVMALVEAGVLEAQGNLRRPRFSEVRLPRSK